MKTNSLFKNLFAGAFIAVIATGLVSCKKDDIDETGSANVKVVNASRTSSPQGFYLADKTVVQGGLSFGNASDGYIVANSGNNLTLQFRNDGSSTAYASTNTNLDKGKYYTVFLAGDGQSARIKVFADDMAAPSSGKAKVRFVHLSDAAPANVDIRTDATTNIAANLARDNASGYVEVNPGFSSLQVYPAGGTTSAGTFNLTAFASGKIYTVYVTGSTANDITVRQVSHN